MNRIDSGYVRNSFSGGSTLRAYSDAVEGVGLWESERRCCEKYFVREYRLLDVGCGAGRTTLGLYRLGYVDIEGLDITPAMVDAASHLAREHGIPLRFVVGDATALPYADAVFEGALFSFNGLMQIPGRDARVRAMREIGRVLKPGGVFLFTTHDRTDAEYADFWAAEKKRWQSGGQDARLHEFGDAIITTEGRETYLHFPTLSEVSECLEEAGLCLLECVRRSELCEESAAVQAFSTDCVFWAARKP